MSMTGRTHDLTAFAALMAVSAFFPPSRMNIPTLFTCLVGNMIGALIPDMDQATNRLWDFLPAGNAVGSFLKKLLIRHRTVSHSLLGIFLLGKFLDLTLPLVFNANYIFIDYLKISVMTGFISHLLADSLTKDGIPLFFPLKFTVGIPPLRIMRISTGKFMENFVFFPAVVACILYLSYSYRTVFLGIFRLIRS